MLWSIIIPPIMFFIAMSIMNICDKKFSDKKKANESGKTLRKLIITSGILLSGMLLASSLAMCLTIDCKNGISVLGAALTSAMVLGNVLIKRYDAPRLTAFMKKGAICAVALLAAEVFLFNGKSFTKTMFSETISPDAMSLADDVERQSDGTFIIPGDSTITISDPDKKAKVMLISLDSQAEHGYINPFAVTLSMSDKNFANSSMVVQRKFTCGKHTNLSFSFSPYEKAKSFNISFSNMRKPVKINEIKLLSAIPFSFSDVRFTILLAIALLLITIKEFRLYDITYDSKKRSHFIAVYVMIVVCTLSGFCFQEPYQEKRTMEYCNCYTDDPFALSLDAFEKGQVYLDLDVDEGLAGLDNVYDFSERDNSGLFSYWDLAYYNGKYYSYFGVAPVFTFYYPYYFITGNVATMGRANSFYTVLGIFFMCLAILAAMKLLKIKPNLLLLLLMLPTSTACMGFWTVSYEIDRYTLPSAAGLCFLMLCLFTGFTACTMTKKKLKPVILFLSGTALTLAVASRPTVALCSALLVPFFIGILLDKNEKLAYRLGLAGSFIAPLAVGAALIMKYNAARFGSPFEFGAVYQLTVSDIHANKLRLSNIPAAIYHYFFQMPRPRNAFPFIDTGMSGLDNYGSYVYTSFGFGALMLPAILCGVLLQPAAFAPRSKELADRRRRQFLTICFCLSVAIAWADFCLGGFITHYVFDIMPLMTFAAMIGIFRSNPKPSAQKHRFVLTSASMVMTMLFIIGIGLNWDESTLLKRFPTLIDRAEDLIIFWK